MDDRTSPASIRAEIAGWLLFALFVLGVWKLRETLDRAYRAR